MTSSISQTRTTAKRCDTVAVTRKNWHSQAITNGCDFLCGSPAVCGEAEGREPGCGDRRVRLGLHPAHCHPGQHAQQRPSSPIGETQRWRPDHVDQRHQPGWAAARHLPGHHKGTLNKFPLYSSALTSSVESVLLAHFREECQVNGERRVLRFFL